MENSEKTEALVSYLHKGYVLCKEHENDKNCREFLISHSNGQYEVKGWASGLGDVNERLVELITNPDSWKITNFNMALRDYPYPWSSKEVDYKFVTFLNW